MTSSPPSSHLAAAVPPESPASPDGNWRQGLRSLWHLSRHLTARADDNHAAPRRPSEDWRLSPPSGRRSSPGKVPRVSSYHRIKPHVPPLVRAPVNSFEFQPCGRTPQVDDLTLSLRHRSIIAPTASHHRLRRGLPGYLILFDPRAFVHQRQSRPREVPSQSAFCVISMHFTATPRIPPTAAESQNRSPGGTPRVEPALFTTGLRNSLRTL